MSNAPVIVQIPTTFRWEPWTDALTFKIAVGTDVVFPLCVGGWFQPGWDKGVGINQRIEKSGIGWIEGSARHEIFGEVRAAADETGILLLDLGHLEAYATCDEEISTDYAIGHRPSRGALMPNWAIPGTPVAGVVDFYLDAFPGNRDTRLDSPEARSTSAYCWTVTKIWEYQDKKHPSTSNMMARSEFKPTVFAAQWALECVLTSNTPVEWFD